jgi:xanthine dehydrogenase YagT iron-sulfur-binding subunit
MDDTRGNGRHGPGPSRRDFLRGGGVAAAATALATPPLLEADEKGAKGDKPAPLGPGAVKLSLTVNGKEMTTRIEPRVTLLDALRNELDVTGCKRVCDRGTCGACTVLLDGEPVYACTTLALEAEGKKVRTAESLVDGKKLDAVPAAFVASDAQQCGFCTPGFVVAMKAVFEKNPKATPEEVERGLAGNICRCGTYEQMRHAIGQLCKPGKEG